MRVLKKIALVAGILVFLILAFLGGTALYVFHHPSRVKGMIENGVSRFAGISCHIRDLSWSFHPLSLRAEGIALRPFQDEKGFYVHIADMQADMALQGAFGQKSLVVEKINLQGLSVCITRDMRLPAFPDRREGGGLWGGILRAAVSTFLFRDLRVEDVSLTGADLLALLGDNRIRADHIRARVGEDRFLTVTFRVEAESPSTGLVLQTDDVRITTDQTLSLDKPDIKWRLSTSNAVVDSPAGRIKKADIQGEFLYRWKDHLLSLQPVDLTLGGVEYIYGSEKIILPADVRVEASGTLNLRDERVEFSRFSVFSGDLLKIEAGIRAETDNGTLAEMEIHDGTLWPRSLRAILPERIREGLAPVDVNGRVSCRGSISVRRQGGTWNLEGDLEARFRDNPYAYELTPRKLAGVLTGTVSIRGTFPQGTAPRMGLQADLRSDKTVLSGTGVDIPPSMIQVSLSGTHPLYTIKSAGLYSPSVKLPFRKREIPIRDIRVDIKEGLLDVRKKSLNFPHILVESSVLRNIRLSLNVANKDIHLSGSGGETNLIQLFQNTGMAPSGWKITGKDAWRFRVQHMENRNWEFHLETGLDDASFQDPDGRFIGEKIRISESLNGEFHPGQGLVIADTDLKITAGEILLDRFYFDLNRHGFFIAGTCRYHIPEPRLELAGITMDLADILKMTVRGGINPAEPGRRTNLQVVIPELPVSPLFEHLLREPFKVEQPILEELEPGGTFSADLDLKGSENDWNMLVNLNWQNGELVFNEQDIILRGFECHLPLWYRTRPAAGGKAAAGSEASKGMISVEEMHLPVLGTQSVRVGLEAGPNSLKTLSPLVLEVPGGRIRVGRVFFKDLFSVQRIVDTRIEIHIKDTRPIFTRLLDRQIPGTIQGELKEVRFKNNTVSSTGQVTAGLFGGEIILSDMAVSGLFTPAPAARLSARWSGIRLSELTSYTEFGKIEGILRGRIKDLEVAYGQPQEFDLLLETVKKEGVPQRISVKAVENIAQIGGGQSPFLGMARILTSFFEEFPYRKIGIHATLENDVFRINGTIKEGGKEYLIKRGGFSGVDVVNQNPDNKIRFKDMMKRIKRVTSSKGGPVIK